MLGIFYPRGAVNDGGAVVSKRNASVLNAMGAVLCHVTPVLHMLSVCRQVRRETHKLVFFDNSLYGLEVAALAFVAPYARTIVYFHNCEAESRKTLVRGPVSLVKWLFAVVSERLVLRFADLCLFISASDRQAAERYLRPQAADVINASMKDEAEQAWPAVWTHRQERAIALQRNPRFLFVGSSYRANVLALRNLIESGVLQSMGVAWSLDVVGSVGLEFGGVRDERIHFHGVVQTLEPWYRGADFLLAPIEHGGGQKIKVIEALMWGLPVIASEHVVDGFRDVTAMEVVLCAYKKGSSIVEHINGLRNDHRAYIEIVRKSRDVFVNHFESRRVTKQLSACLAGHGS